MQRKTFSWIADDQINPFSNVSQTSVPHPSSVFVSKMQAQSGVELTVLGSWSLPKEGQESMESFLRDLSTIFPQQRWLQVSRQMGKMGFICEVVNRNQSKILRLESASSLDFSFPHFFILDCARVALHDSQLKIILIYLKQGIGTA